MCPCAIISLVFRRRDKRPSKTAPASGKALAMVLFERPEPLTPDALKEGWRAAWPRCAPPTDFFGDTDDNGTSSMTCQLDTMTGALGMMPARIPGGELERATAWLWPNAEVELTRADAHAIVWVSGPVGQVDAHCALTRLIAAVVNSTETLGVYLGGAGHVIRANVFDEMARHYLDHDLLPALLWIDFQVGVDDGRATLLTRGMTEFGLMELEVERSQKSPGELREFAMNIAEYLLREGAVIRHGDTVGENENQRVRVRHAPSVADRPGPVYRFEGL